MPLKRVVGLTEALAINLGAIIGAGIFVISGIAAGIAGPSTIIAILIGGFVSLLTGISFVQLSHTFASEGGTYDYAKRTIGQYAAIVVGIMFIVSSIVGGAVVALSFASYFSSIFGSGISLTLIAALLIAVLGAINYFGVKGSAQTSLILTALKIAILVFFIIVGIFYINTKNYTPFIPGGYGGLFEASAFIFFAYTGFARVTTMAEEIKDPKRTIPKAIIYSIIMSAALYALVAFVLLGMVNYKLLATSQSPLDLAILSATKNKLFSYIISIGALFATINVDLSLILGISRVTFAMSRDRNLPVLFSRLNRFGAPHIAIIMATAVMIISAMTMNFKEIASLSNSASLLSYAIANAAAIMLTLNYRRQNRLFFRSKYFIAIPIFGLASIVFLIFFLTTLSLYITLAILILITAYYPIASWNRKRSLKKF